MSNVTIRRDSFAKTFSASLGVPTLLLAFADWLAKNGSVGSFDVLGAMPLAEAFVEPRLTQEMQDKIGIFLFLGDGSYLALWDYSGVEPAVVLLGSEGELDNVAATFASFLAALSRGETEIGSLDEDDEDDEGAILRRNALAAWLASLPRQEPAPHTALPCFGEWYEAKLEGREPPPIVTRKSGAAPAISMDDLSSLLVPLFGRTLHEEAVADLLEALGHWPLRHFKSSDIFGMYTPKLERGYCLLFKRVPDTLRPGANVAALQGCFFYAEGAEGYRAFAQTLPLGITWQDSSASLVARLGAPSSEIRNKKSGKLTSQRWQYCDAAGAQVASAYAAVAYVDDGARLQHVFLGLC